MFIFDDSEDLILEDKEEEESLDVEDSNDDVVEEENNEQEELLDFVYLNDKNCYETLPVDKKKRSIFMFWNADEESFINITQVYEDNAKEMKYFSKLRHHYPVSHFLDKPERPKHVYEKQYWSFTFFDRFVVRLRYIFGPLNSSPFSLSGDCYHFEKETLYSPQSCPIYVLKSRDLMINNMKRFSRITAALQKDEYDEESFDGYFPDDDGLEIKKFLKRRSSRVVEDDISKVPTVNIDRGNIPDSISNYYS